MSVDPGRRVRMTDNYKQTLLNNSSEDHVHEFGNCIGIVIGLTHYITGVGPEVDVRWLPSNLRYAYHPDNLQVLPRFTELVKQLESEYPEQDRRFHVLAARYLLGADTKETLERLSRWQDGDYYSGNEYHRCLLTPDQLKAILTIDRH